MKIPKRPGAAMREAFEKRKRESMREYFESIQIHDIDHEVVDSKILSCYEEQRIKKVYICPNKYKIYEI
jgi:hypothetical protein